MTWHGRCGTIVVKFQYESPPKKKTWLCSCRLPLHLKQVTVARPHFWMTSKRDPQLCTSGVCAHFLAFFFFFRFVDIFKTCNCHCCSAGRGKKITTTITVGVKRSCPALLGRLCIEGWIKHFGCPPKFADLVQLSLAVSKMRALQLYSPTSFHHVRCLYDLQ